MLQVICVCMASRDRLSFTLACDVAGALRVLYCCAVQCNIDSMLCVCILVPCNLVAVALVKGAARHGLCTKRVGQLAKDWRWTGD